MSGRRQRPRAVAKAIVERHGGTFTARNDNGAIFEIRLAVPQH